METCPDCRSEFTRRIARTWWMRLFFPNSVRITCDNCGTVSLLRRPARAAKQ